MDGVEQRSILEVIANMLGLRFTVLFCGDLLCLLVIIVRFLPREMNTKNRK